MPMTEGDLILATLGRVGGTAYPSTLVMRRIEKRRGKKPRVVQVPMQLFGISAQGYYAGQALPALIAKSEEGKPLYDIARQAVRFGACMVQCMAEEVRGAPTPERA